jgi:outer membrane protein assembly factor BamB
MMRQTLLQTVLGALVAQWAVGGASLVASKEGGWPQWRGPRRDGICLETGLLKTWPEGGPKRRWTADNLGRGYSAPIITGGRIYITGDVGTELHVFALGLDGELLWTTPNGRAWRRNHQGSRSSCTVDGGQLFHMNAHGRVACFDPATGREQWHVDTLARFKGEPNTWGLSESVVVDGDRVIVTPGGNDAFMAALDRNTGKTVWKSNPLPSPRKEKMGYASPILFELKGKRLLVNVSQRQVVCVDADTGKLYWHHVHPTKYNANCSTPVLVGDAVFHTTPTGSGCILLKIIVDGDDVRYEQVWKGEMDNISGGAVFAKGYIYGSGQRNCTWTCIDPKTGKHLYDSKELVQGCLLYADDRLYVLSEKGMMALVKPGPERFEIVSSFRLASPKGRQGDVWTHPVVLDGRLYLRYHEKLHCYDIKAN